MTSKNSCFDRAIFRRSLRRTAPVWGLFCLYELLLPLRLYSYCRGVSVCTEDFFVQAERTILENAVTGASVVPFVYGMPASQTTAHNSSDDTSAGAAHSSSPVR